jgi:predicted Zn-dependent peptidase
MIDRKLGPEIHKIEKLFIPKIEQYTLQNGVKVCEVNIGSQEIIKIEVVHFAGRSFEDYRLISRATSSLMKEGSGEKTSAQIASEIDFYGSSIKTASNMDFSYTTVYTLTKHFDKILPLLHELYFNPIFNEDEIEKFKKLNIQKLREELTKNDVISYRNITEMIFGKEHSYGYNSIEADYKNIEKSRIIEHHKNYLASDNCHIFLSGKINDNVRRLVSEYFGHEIKQAKCKNYIPSAENLSHSRVVIKSKNEHQSAIKIGRKLFDKHHPDNACFFVLNTVFGGYFGSRLMTSIREDLGYTYDIYSSVDQMLFDGCFYVSTEADPQYEVSLITEVYRQMEILQLDKVSKKELEMVKSYLLGNFMNMLDGPMNVSSFAKSMVLIDKKPQDFNDFVSEIIEMKPSNLLHCAQKYFNPADMKEVVISPK